MSFTLDQVSQLATTHSIKTPDLKPSYLARLPAAKADALNIAKSVPVTQKLRNPPTLAVSPAPHFSHTVAVESLRVRSGPKKSTPQLFALKGGTAVRVVKDQGGWVLVDAGEGRIGWVYAKMLRPAGDQLAAQN